MFSCYSKIHRTMLPHQMGTCFLSSNALGFGPIEILFIKPAFCRFMLHIETAFLPKPRVIPLSIILCVKVRFNTSNKIMQLVAQYCCVASYRVNVARITTLIFSCAALLHEVEAFYSLQQRKFAAREVVIRETFTLQLATQQCCAMSCMILLLILPHFYSVKLFFDLEPYTATLVWCSANSIQPLFELFIRR